LMKLNIGLAKQMSYPVPQPGGDRAVERIFEFRDMALALRQGSDGFDGSLRARPAAVAREEMNALLVDALPVQPGNDSMKGAAGEARTFIDDSKFGLRPVAPSVQEFGRGAY
ncbi:hypothetical protein, partial [Mesorhizobium sp. M8A.F.Ca.ET.142.01.1.1]|uniref:hypothetical protein n=1 Tax=Mesorhizobium sp. M8A.F.Ca.ET.142.01.1.1 TaxID=2563958 RepID=UPI001677EF0E